MSDQASQLRALVRAAGQSDGGAAAAPPQRIVVCGGKGGVGATTIAVYLSVALARLGSRVVLVDADMNHADVAALCQLETRDTIADVLSARRTVHEALLRGPAGIQILAGMWSATHVADCSPGAQDRLLGELDRLGRHADLVVLDVGGGLNHVVSRFWQAADAVVLVTTPDRIAVMDAYAAVKVLGANCGVEAQLIVNRADTQTAGQVHARINGACERFLNRSVWLAGHVVENSAVSHAAATGRALPLDSSQHPAGRDIDAVAERLLARWRDKVDPSCRTTSPSPVAAA